MFKICARHKTLCDLLIAIDSYEIPNFQLPILNELIQIALTICNNVSPIDRFTSPLIIHAAGVKREVLRKIEIQILLRWCAFVFTLQKPMGDNTICFVFYDQ